MRIPKLVVAAVLLFVVLAGKVHAGTLISNLDSGRILAGWFIGDDGFGVDGSLGVRFKTPAESFELDDIVVRLFNLEDTDDPLIRLFSDSLGAPVTPLVLFSDPTDFSVGVIDHTLTPTSAFSFDPSTTYWLVMQNSNFHQGERFDWVVFGPSFTGPATYLGVDVGINGIPPGPATAARAIPFFQINATPTGVIPEPTSLAIFGIGAIGMLGMGIRRRKRQQTA